MTTPNYLLAHRATSINEGGYANDPDDKGGETYAGITRKWYPNWAGWKILDGISNKRINAIYLQLSGLVETFYYENYWKKHRLEELVNVKLACNIYDYLVTSDRDAIQMVQRCLGLKDDGVMGPKTISACNSTDGWVLNANYLMMRMEFYTSLAFNDPTQRKFYKNWITRTAKYA